MYYVMSDIHGQYAAFMAMLEMIDFKASDRLCVLGDVIDRGPHGVSLLRRIMKAENISMILGNHEMMMFDALVKYNGQIINSWHFNGYEPTLDEFAKLPFGTQKEILFYISTLDSQRTVTVGGKTFCLVHGRPALSPEELKPLQSANKFIDNKADSCAWERFVPGSIKREGVTFVFGHTPTSYFQEAEPLEIFFGDGCIGVDCGCVIGEKPGRLGCLRLNDLKTFYADL